jgi:hypothetical protein
MSIRRDEGRGIQKHSGVLADLFDLLAMRNEIGLDIATATVQHNVEPFAVCKWGGGFYVEGDVLLC